MPNMDGIIASQKINTLYGIEAPKIVAATANAFASYKEQCFAAGMADILSKPILMAELKAILIKYSHTPLND